MDLRQGIAEWDGKSAHDIGRLFRRHAGEDRFASEVLSLLPAPELQNGASWLLKKYLEEGGTPSAAMARSAYGSLSKLTHWEARLHLLQCIPYLPITVAQKPRVEAFLRDCLVDDAKFVRAWAYGGFHYLAEQYPEYRHEKEQLFEMAMRDEPASVRARIRQVLKG